MNACPRAAAVAVCLAACFRCQGARPSEPAPVENAPPSPDRLSAGERLPEAEVAFGLPLPAALRLVRNFDDAAYFAGDVAFDELFEHVRRHVLARDVQLVRGGAVFPRAYLLGDETKRLLRIDLARTARGTQLHVKDITPPPSALMTGLSDEDKWRMAGRRPDGSPLDPNRDY